MNKQLVSIITPAYNEEKLIETFLNDLVSVLEEAEIQYEVLIVENGSKDRTADKIKKIIKKNKQIKLISIKNPSYGLSLIKGLRESKGEFGVIFNVDYWDERFLLLTKVNILGYDIVSASKLLPGSRDYRRFYRRFITWNFNKFIRLVFGYKGTDTHGIKVFRMKSVLPVVNRCKTKSGIFDSELMIRAQKKNLKILELPAIVEEIRAPRFNLSRVLQTPKDIFNLWRVLNKNDS